MVYSTVRYLKKSAKSQSYSSADAPNSIYELISFHAGNRQFSESQACSKHAPRILGNVPRMLRMLRNVNLIPIK